MFKPMTAWFTLALALATPVVAQTTPTARPPGEARVTNLLGATGLLQIPSAYLLRDRELSVFIDGDSGAVSGGAAVGVGHRFEVGLAALGANNDLAGGARRTLADAKLGLFKETLILPAVSVGVVDAFDRLHKDPGWYVVVSKYLIPYFVEAVTGHALALKLHLGFGAGIYENDVFAGAELFPVRNLSAMAEYAHGDWNIGGRLYSRRFQATVGLLDFRRVAGGIRYAVTLR
jgi:hypothetical protein